jgi:serine/threonine protein kinase
LREARITGQLQHPSIAPVYELVETPESGQAFYTMRFIKGRTLADAIRDYHEKRRNGQARKLELIQLLQSFMTACNAVAYAHSRGVIHRDLKGQNIVLGDFGEVIVLDWGLAKMVAKPGEVTVDFPGPEQDRGAEDAMTVQGQVLGTPAYMAPEQAAGLPGAVGPISDVYSLGAILYTILTGQAPFVGTSTSEVIRKVLEEEPVPPRQVYFDIPAGLEAVCLRALAKDPKLRQESAGQLRREVFTYHQSVGTVEPPAGEGADTLARRIRLFHEKKPAGKMRRADLMPLVQVLTAGCTMIASGDRKGGKRFSDLTSTSFILSQNGEYLSLQYTPALQTEMIALSGAAPEQAAKQEEPIGPHTDVYRLGTVLYEILTGRREPYTWSTPEELMRKIRAEEPIPPSQVLPGVPPDLEAICLKALARRPEDRYHSPAALAQELTNWLLGRPVSVWRSSRVVQVWNRLNEPVLVKRWFLAWASGVLSLIIVAPFLAACYWFWKSPLFWLSVAGIAVILALLGGIIGRRKKSDGRAASPAAANSGSKPLS